MAQSFNPYAAPQTRDLPVAELADTPIATEALAVLPREVKRWMYAALTLYALSFVVPFAPWYDYDRYWEFGTGIQLFIAGAFYFWHPYAIAWWANLFFLLTCRNLYQVDTKKVLLMASLG